ncbi:hypothetical protein ACFC26_27985 [Kitasatospora purpeofusca]|uniref:hypothetical protein n=1 Tax=Kitasatospora purpeofusca TaxID=67352 RepID=UPI0035DAFB61
MNELTPGTFNASPLGTNSVTVYRPMVFGPQAPVHTLDLMVLVHLLFAVRDNHKLAPLTLWRELQEAGVRSAKNANELVGKNAVYESIARLIALGYVRRVELPNEKHPGRRGPIAYQVFEDPSQNPVQQASATTAEAESSQVTMLPGMPEAGFGLSGHSDVPAGQNASRNAGAVVPGSGVPGSWKRDVPPGQNASRVPGSIGLPLHTSGGGKTPPTPHVPPVPSVPSEPRTGRGRVRSANQNHGFSPEAISAAQDFLAELPTPFACGIVDQRKHAPLLLETIERQGWELGPELARALTSKPATGLNSPTRALKARFGELPRRSVVLRDSAPDTAPGPENPCPDHPRLEASGCRQCATDDAVDRQRRALDAERGIDDESARAALAALIQRGQKPRTTADRGREAAARQADEARRQSARRAKYLAG